MGHILSKVLTINVLCMGKTLDSGVLGLSQWLGGEYPRAFFAVPANYLCVVGLHVFLTVDQTPTTKTAIPAPQPRFPPTNSLVLRCPCIANINSQLPTPSQ